MQHVTDARSNANDQIAYAARTIGNSTRRREVFEAVCFGKRATKRVSEIMETTGLSRKQVLTAGKYLADHHLFESTLIDGETAYTKDSFLAQKRKDIFKLIDKPERLASLPTKTNPSTSKSSLPTVIKVELPDNFVNVRSLSIDDVDSFHRVRKIQLGQTYSKVSEEAFKTGLKNVLGEVGEFKDWGGEMNDLFSSALILDGKRIRAAFALKGPGKQGKLVPGMMGKNGDQIQRLYQVTADVYVLQYWAQIDQSVHVLMHNLAVAASASGGGRPVNHLVVDGSDSTRLIKAYPEHFGGVA